MKHEIEGVVTICEVDYDTTYFEYAEIDDHDEYLVDVFRSFRGKRVKVTIEEVDE